MYTTPDMYCNLDLILRKYVFLDWVENQGYIIKNDLPELDSYLKLYQRIHKNIVNKDETIYTENYEILNLPSEYYLPKDKDDDYSRFQQIYSLVYRKDKLKFIVESQKLKPYKIDISNYPNNLKIFNYQNSTQVSEYTDTPLFLIEFEPYCLRINSFPLTINSNTLVLLDGQKRFSSLVDNNNSNNKIFRRHKIVKEITAYILPPQLHIDLLIHQNFKILYKINSNLNYIRKYMTNEINYTRLNQLLYELK